MLDIVDVGESELSQQIADDADHGVVVVHHEDRHRHIDRHCSCSRTPFAGARAVRP